jgi:hypothetical protein
MERSRPGRGTLRAVVLSLLAGFVLLGFIIFLWLIVWE